MIKGYEKIFYVLQGNMFKEDGKGMGWVENSKLWEFQRLISMFL